jgi:hypothetical protein
MMHHVTFEESPKEFFAMLVWNYKESRIQILELTQAGLKRELMALASDKEDWGDPRKYDISITKSGEGLETTYAMTPKPPKKRSDEINEAVKNLKANLTALYDGGDPFEMHLHLYKNLYKKKPKKKRSHSDVYW